MICGEIIMEQPGLFISAMITKQTETISYNTFSLKVNEKYKTGINSSHKNRRD